MSERLKQLERSYWWKWPEWLCRWFTSHALVKEWARYDCDVSGRSCRCGWYDEVDYGS